MDTQLLDIANGLDYLHSFPMVHGDLSSNNVLLDRNCNACLTDFGCASLIGELPEGFTYLKASTARPGTLRWTAPEHLSPDREGSKHTIKSDIYSLGNMALLLLSGKLPWSEVQHDALIVLNLFQGIKPARPLARPIDDQHWALVEQCWSSIPERPPAAEVVFSLQQFLRAYPPPAPLFRDNVTTSAPSVPNGPRGDHVYDNSNVTLEWIDHANHMDPFAEGPHYGPVLEPFLARVVGATVKINPLLGPSHEAHHLRWNMHFPAHDGKCFRTTEFGKPWSKGRKMPATHPRLTHVQVISGAFPWMIHARAQNPKLGVTCGEVLDAISMCMYGDVSKKEYEHLPVAKKHQVWKNYQFNRSSDPNVPGGRLGEAMKRLDWLSPASLFGGLTANDTEFVKGQCGVVLPCTFTLKCLERYP